MKDSGGQAFPCPTGAADVVGESKIYYNKAQFGMTLLDHFAGMIIADGAGYIGTSDPTVIPREVKRAYDIAEAMIAEKRKREAPHDSRSS